MKESNIDGNLNGVFTELNTINHNVWEGGKSSVALTDINDDNLVDIIIGNQCGGLAYFKGDTTTNTSTSEILLYFSLVFNQGRIRVGSGYGLARIKQRFRGKA